MPPKKMETLCAHAGEDRRRGEPFVTPIAQTTMFHLGTADDAERLFGGQEPGYSYTRFGNPTVDKLAESLAALEGGAAALVMASGNAATLAALTMCLRGKDDLVVAPADSYGGTTEILRIMTAKFGVPHELVPPADWIAAVERATVVFAETPTNPLLRLVDMQATVAAARKHGARVVIDNTVATPYNQKPLALGADLVIHSLSKYLNGHSDVIGGAVVSPQPFSAEAKSIHKNLGGTVNAIDAWLTLRGLRTFAVRMAVHNANGLAVAKYLAAHPAVARVYYPGFDDADVYARQMTGGGALLSCELRGGMPAAKAFVDKLQVFVHAVSLGGMESLVTLPAATSHRGMSAEQRRAAGVADGLVRLSVGIEHVDDLMVDLAQALT